MAQTHSIDRAANGFLRHRFVRALSAAWLVLIVFAILGASAGYAAVNVRDQGLAGLGTMALALPLVFVLFLVPTMLGVALGGALVELLHRRLVALILLPASIVLLVFCVLSLLVGPFAKLSPEVAALGRAQDALLMQVALTGLGFFGTLVALQCVRQSWWQLSADRESFRAVRGWRPSPWRLFTTFRRHLGLPSFIAQIGRGRLSLSVLYFAVAVLNLGIVAILLGPLMIVPTENTEPEFASPVIATLAALLVLNLLGAGALIQRLADGRATKLYQKVREWDARPPVVFLRAFDQDDDKLPMRSRDLVAKFPAGCGSPRTLDEILLEHASPYGPVIAIGDPRDPTPPLGAARVFVEGKGEEWKDVVTSLLAASSVVVMAPSTSHGVKWELDLVGDAIGRLRVIFLANPNLPRDQTIALFQEIAPDHGLLQLEPKEIPIAAYLCPKNGWRVLTTSKPFSVQSYTVALNVALQALLGMQGVAAKRQRKKARMAA